MPTVTMKDRLATLLLIIPAFLSFPLNAEPTHNGFDLSNSMIDTNEIHQGGPPRDGIPAIDNPIFIESSDAIFLNDNARILGISLNGQHRVYPISIMNWHEIVNDTIVGHDVAITYCPLCGTGMAFTSNTGTSKLRFGVSGLLYNSDVLLYDRQTKSLWSQILSQAISGPLKGTMLTLLPLEHTTWGHWKKRYPNSLVLSQKTGYSRDYDRDPYAGYEDKRGLYFPVAQRDPRYHPKERVLGIEVNGKFKAYPFAELSKNTASTIHDSFNGDMLTVNYDHHSHSAYITNDDGDMLPAVTAFWFAWYAFHPQTAVYTAADIK